ncbi:MAG TPA: hypothetical protein VK969_13060 [Acidimicrobiia bacterium]|nr:hypothetical protein [Acidimicrobiia bacterium]
MLLVVVAIAVALIIAFSGGDMAEQSESPIPSDVTSGAPAFPGQ